MTDPAPRRDVVFLDVETNGRDPERHVAWEVAAWNLTTGHRCEFVTHLPDLPYFLGSAEPVALRVNRFLDRYPLDETAPSHEDTEGAIGNLCDVLDGGRNRTLAEARPCLPVIVGSNPGFDIAFTTKLLVGYGFDVTRRGFERWHYHPIDLGAYAAGVLGVEPGTSSLSARQVAEWCGVAPGDHSAGGDVTSGGVSFERLAETARLIATDPSAAAVGPRMVLDTLAAKRAFLPDSA